MINTQASYYKADLFVHLFRLSYDFLQNSIIIIYHILLQSFIYMTVIPSKLLRPSR